MASTLVLASSNAGKLRELRALLEPHGFSLVAQSELGVPDCPEPYPTFVENALTKARHASKHTGLPALADDSGICVNALGGAPGVYSARYAGEPKSDAANNAKLVAALQGVADRSAYFCCVLVFVRHADDPRPLIAEGIWQGEVVDAPVGEGGFGYDPHLYIPALKKGVAELSKDEKSQHSHRGQAMRILLEKLLQSRPSVT